MSPRSGWSPVQLEPSPGEEGGGHEDQRDHRAKEELRRCDGAGLHRPQRWRGDREPRARTGQHHDLRGRDETEGHSDPG